MAEDLGKNIPVLQPSVQHLMTCPHLSLHHPLLLRFGIIHVAVVALTSLNLFAQVKEVGKDFVEHFMSVFTCWIETLNPHQPPPTQGVHAQLAVQGKFPHVLVGPEGVPLAFITYIAIFCDYEN